MKIYEPYAKKARLNSRKFLLFQFQSPNNSQTSKWPPNTRAAPWPRSGSARSHFSLPSWPRLRIENPPSSIPSSPLLYPSSIHPQPNLDTFLTLTEPVLNTLSTLLQHFLDNSTALPLHILDISWKLPQLFLPIALQKCNFILVLVLAVVTWENKVNSYYD